MTRHNSGHTHSASDELLGLGAVSATKHEASGECPADEMLAALVENALSVDERKACMEHISGCEDCYENWTLLSDHMETVDQPVVSRENAIGLTRVSDLLNALRDWFQDLSTPALVAVPVAAMAILVLTVLVVPSAPEYQRQLQIAYIAAIDQHRYTPETIADLPLPWKREALGFGLSTKQTREQREFAAGLRDGQLLLSGTSVETRETDRPYYQTGRWVALAWILTQSSYNNEDWDNLSHSGMALLEALSDSGHKSNLSIIKHLGEALAMLDSDRQSLRDRRDLKHTLELLIHEQASASPGE